MTHTELIIVGTPKANYILPLIDQIGFYKILEMYRRPNKTSNWTDGSEEIFTIPFQNVWIPRNKTFRTYCTKN